MSVQPKLFFSYCWSSPEHEQWVIDLATQLRESGVDVILDKWDLKEGQDSVAFMEKMVTDPSIKKVAVISDEAYADRADGRAGGVGTETQIISREVYEQQDQQKFVAILPCKDDLGKPYLPTYYKGRIYIDLSESDRYAENFEKLLRWIFDKPLHIKPEIGAKPGFLSEQEHISLGTTAMFNRCIDSIKNTKANSVGAIDEYFTTFADNLERFRITRSENKEFDDLVMQSIEEFVPYRNQVIQLITAISQYSPTIELAQKTHRFFERLIPYMYKPLSASQWNEDDFDNFRFVIHELFLYAVSTLIKYERFDLANEILTQQFYIPENSYSGNNNVKDFLALRLNMRSLEFRNNRLGLRRLSMRADLIKKRAELSGFEFKNLMQLDFILFIRSDLNTNNYSKWWPDTLLYAGHSYSPFEIFARSVSKNYFNRVKCLLGIETPLEINALLDLYKTDRKKLPSWDWDTFEPSVLLGFDALCTKP
jgi:TIR domain